MPGRVTTAFEMQQTACVRERRRVALQHGPRSIECLASRCWETCCAAAPASYQAEQRALAFSLRLFRALGARTGILAPRITVPNPIICPPCFALLLQERWILLHTDDQPAAGKPNASSSTIMFSLLRSTPVLAVIELLVLLLFFTTTWLCRSADFTVPEMLYQQWYACLCHALPEACRSAIHRVRGVALTL